MISLINPPSPFLLDERVFMPLGVLKVAASLQARGVQLQLLDLAGTGAQADQHFMAHLRQHQPPCVGFTCTTPQLPVVVHLARIARTHFPSARLILGGPHVTLVHAAWRREQRVGQVGRAAKAWSQLKDEFDVLVAGDGEKAIVAAMEPDSPAVLDADHPKSELWVTEAELDQAPWPARHLLDVSSYRYAIDGRPSLSLIAQLGCPFNCGFCGGRESAMLRVARFRQPAGVAQEVRHLFTRYGVTGFMFYDDELNISQPGLLALLHELKELQAELRVDFRFRGFVKAQLFNQAQADAMYQAGFRWILVGFETGDERVLVNINKKATKQQNTRCLEYAKRAGLKVKALMSLGHPGESHATIDATRDWLLATQPDDFDLTVITCYPGTPYYDHAVPHSVDGEWVYTCPTGDRLYQQDVDYTTTMDYYKGVPGTGYHSYVYTDSLSGADLVQRRDQVDLEVRQTLRLPAPGQNLYEHTMGQPGTPAV